MSNRRGSRGGNVRRVQDARSLQETFKAELSARIREAIVTALDRGQYHADDLASLEIPAEHLNCVGSQVALLVRQGVMRKTSMRRNRAAASNARWSGVYEYEADGREKLAGFSTGVQVPRGSDVAPCRGVGRSTSAESGEDSPEVTTGASGEPTRLFDLPSMSAITNREAA